MYKLGWLSPCQQKRFNILQIAKIQLLMHNHTFLYLVGKVSFPFSDIANLDIH